MWLWIRPWVSQLQIHRGFSSFEKGVSLGSWSQFMHSGLSHQTTGNVTSFLLLLWFFFFFFCFKKRWGIRNVLGPAPKKWSCSLLPLHLPLHRIPGSRWFPLHALSLSLHCCLYKWLDQLPNSLFTNTFPIFFQMLIELSQPVREDRAALAHWEHEESPLETLRFCCRQIFNCSSLFQFWDAAK